MPITPPAPVAHNGPYVTKVTVAGTIEWTSDPLISRLDIVPDREPYRFIFRFAETLESDAFGVSVHQTNEDHLFVARLFVPGVNIVYVDIFKANQVDDGGFEPYGAGFTLTRYRPTMPLQAQPLDESSRAKTPGAAEFPFNDTIEQIRAAARTGWDSLLTALNERANTDIVKLEWNVDYDRLGHDILVQARVKVASSDAVLLQVWAKDQHPGIWIPELRPWAASVAAFEASQNIKQVTFGLIDSKWRPEDAGQTYKAVVWGYVDVQGEQIQFGPYVKEFVYPG